MRKWEEKYEEYKSGKLDEKLSELSQKDDCTKEEKEELKKLNKVKENLPRIENVLEYREKAKSLLNEVDKELIRRQNLKEANQQKSDLEKEMETLLKEEETLHRSLKEKEKEINNKIKELQDNKLTETEKEVKGKELEQLKNEKAELSKKYENNTKSRNENNGKFFRNDEILINNIGYKSKLSNKTDKDLNAIALNLVSRISKCNIAARNMVEGRSWKDIEKELKNFKERTVYRPTNRKLSEIKNKKENKDITPEELENISKNIKKIKEEKVIKKLEEDDAEKKLEVEEQHEEKKGSFGTRFLDKIKGAFNKIKSRFNKKNALPETNPEKEETKKEEIEKEEIKTEKHVTEEELGLRADFMKQLKDITFKGVETEKKGRQEATMEKLAEMREANRKEEDKKYSKIPTEKQKAHGYTGENYGDKSR